MSFVTVSVKPYVAPSSVHPLKVKPFFTGFFGLRTVSPSFTVNDSTSDPSANAPPSAMKVTMRSVTPGSFSHFALSAMSFVTASAKSYSAPPSVHPWKVKPALRGSSCGRGAFPPCSTRCSCGSGSPPSAMKLTVCSLDSHCASSTRSSVTGSVKSYSALPSIHPVRAEPFFTGSVGRFANVPFATSTSIRSDPSANLPPFAT